MMKSLWQLSKNYIVGIIVTFYHLSVFIKANFTKVYLEYCDNHSKIDNFPLSLQVQLVVADVWGEN